MQSTDPTPASGISPGGCLLRVVWMGFGNAALVFAAIHVAATRGSTSAEVLFAGVVIALLAARSLDVLRFGGLTTDGRPATREHLVRYGVGLAIVSAALFALAHFASGLGLEPTS